MDDAVTRKSRRSQTAELKQEIAAMLREIEQLHLQIRADPEVYEQSRARTRAILDEIAALR
jgi:hypothetical protein